MPFGHSTDDPTRPQRTIAAAILDPLGLPLITTVVPGNRPDDPLYLPALRAAKNAGGVRGRTFVGGGQMAAHETRGAVASGDDFYLGPLSESQLRRADRDTLLRPVWDGARPLHRVERPGPEGQGTDLVAEGFSIDIALTADVAGKEVSWTGRRWLVRSVAYAPARGATADRHLATAEAGPGERATRKQGRKRLSETELTAADAILTREGVTGLLTYTVTATPTTRHKRGYAGRPESDETTMSLAVQVRRNEGAIQEKKRALGWQVYASNDLTRGLAHGVWAYRGQDRMENDRSRLTGRPPGLTPIDLQDEQRIAGLVYLLSVALRILTLTEWVVRERLRQTGEKLHGAYAGQAGRKTATPSAELLLEVMKTIGMRAIEVDGQQYVLLSPLTEVQKKLLTRWGLPADLYENVVRNFPKPPRNTSEP
ncbi:IS1634 family transposase [Fimbriiglobus ruber]|uniref:IS1634 family transposase n=1 Tax=Fimbriiglobus ruber TaxID=1908690 RepID=UPI0026ACCE1E